MNQATRRDFLKLASFGLTAVAIDEGNLFAQAPADPTQWTATQAVAALKAKRISAEELVKVAVARAERLREMHLFTTMNPEKALAAARDVDRRRAAARNVGPLAGLPLTIKDNIDSAALPTTAGSAAFAGWQPKQNAPVLASLLRAGGVMLGKANLDEMMVNGNGNNPVYGAVQNPYNRRLISGGSSAGTAAAIAARVVAAGLGADTGGSIRIPAALCGCVGFRPTMGRYPTAGIIGLTWTMDTPGPLGRTVADVALLDSICALRPTSKSTLKFAGTRIAIPPFAFDGIDPAMSAAVEGALSALRRAGAVLVNVDIPPALRQAPGVGASEAPGTIAKYLSDHGSQLSVREIVQKVQTESARGMLLSTLQGSPSDWTSFAGALAERRVAHVAQVAAYFKSNNLGAVLLPTTVRPALTYEALQELNRQRATPGNRNTVFGSGAGLPCLSVPVGLTASGLPVGMEIVGLAEGDGIVLRLGGELEKLVGQLPPPKLV